MRECVWQMLWFESDWKFWIDWVVNLKVLMLLRMRKMMIYEELRIWWMMRSENGMGWNWWEIMRKWYGIIEIWDVMMRLLRIMLNWIILNWIVIVVD